MTDHSGILSNPFFAEIILPFVLIFVLVFAILQKSKVLGDGKRQIDAMVSLVIALMAVSFGYAVGIILALMPFLAVSAVVILVFMILHGMVYKEGEFEMTKGLRIAFAIISGIALLIALLVATGGWEYMISLVGYLAYSESGGGIVANFILFAVIAAAVAVVLWGGKSGGGKGKDK
jgi:hypothetical protein